jgi:hypothetical protein
MAVTKQSWTAESGWYNSHYQIGRTSDITVSTAVGRGESNGESARIWNGDAVDYSPGATEESHEDCDKAAMWPTNVNAH